MLVTLKIIGYYILSIAFLFAAVIGVIFCVAAFIDFTRKQFSRKPLTFFRVILSIVKSFFGFIFFGAIAFTLIGVSVYILDLSEPEDCENRLDKWFAEMTNVEENRIDKILVEIYKSNSRSKGSGGSRAVHYYVKNFNEKEFKGTFTLYLKLDAEIIDQKEVNIQLKNGELASEAFLSADFKKPKGSWRGI